jgi:hypothetical protein
MTSRNDCSNINHRKTRPKKCGSCKKCPLCEKPSGCKSKSHKPQTRTYNVKNKEEKEAEITAPIGNGMVPIVDLSLSSPNAIATDPPAIPPETPTERQAKLKGMRTYNFKYAPPDNAIKDKEYDDNDVDTEIILKCKYPKDGFSGTSERTKQRIKSVLGDLIKKLIATICSTTDEQMLATVALFELYGVARNDVVEDKLLPATLTVLKSGSKTSKCIASALLSAAYGRDEINDIFVKKNENVIYYFGRKRWSTYIKLYSDISRGLDLNTKRYKCRIHPRKMSTALEFVSGNSQILPGQLRSITFFNHTFYDMPVFERGIKNYEDFFALYAKKYERSNRVGLKTFTVFCKLLQRPVKQKTCLSSYYLDFVNLNSNILLMLETLDNLLNNPLWVNQWKEKWNEIYRFCKYGYFDHLELNDQPYHSIHLALTKSIDCAIPNFGRNEATTCVSCHNCFTFFSDFKVCLLF